MTRNTAESRRTGATIKALREAYGWRLSKFAVAIGISHSYLANIEAGRRPITPELARKIADTLSVPLAAITTAFELSDVA